MDFNRRKTRKIKVGNAFLGGDSSVKRQSMLNIPAEELLKRFVRGDASRHTEGSGLGLAIVQSLTELQGGSLQLAIDGDLFKVRLTFPLYTPEDAAQAASSGKETP